MSAGTPLFYRNEKHGKTQPRIMDFTFQITAAKTVVLIPRGADVLSTFDALTQAQIDAYLSSTTGGYTSTVLNGFTAAQFDATSMGTNAFGGIINMQQQAQSVIRMEAKLYSGAGLATVLPMGALGSAGLTASTLETAVGISPAGDLAFKVILTGVDALTAGMIVIQVAFISK